MQKTFFLLIFILYTNSAKGNVEKYPDNKNNASETTTFQCKSDVKHQLSDKPTVECKTGADTIKYDPSFNSGITNRARLEVYTQGCFNYFIAINSIDAHQNMKMLDYFLSMKLIEGKLEPKALDVFLKAKEKYKSKFDLLDNKSKKDECLLILSAAENLSD